MNKPGFASKNKWLVPFLISLIAAVGSYWFTPVFSQSASLQTKVFEAAWQTVNDHFFDPKFNGVDWSQMRSQYEPAATQSRTTEALASIINQMLAELKTSHTHFYTQAEPAYYQIAGIFGDNVQKSLKPFLANGKIDYTGIGLYTETINGKTFIKTVLDGFPAAEAGLKVGDQLLSVNDQPFQPIRSFEGKANQKVAVQIQRTPNAAPLTLTVVPKTIDPTTMFLDAMKASVAIIKRDGKKIGYVHIWSYADDIYQDLLEEELSYGRLSQVDGLVWDIRDGWGGASPTYLNPFTAPVPTVTFIPRDGRPRTRDYQWKKPVVMLINQGSRSGKEILAYAFRKYGVGKIVGSKTQGAVVGGRPYVMPDGSLLYLAVSDVLVDGERLEGNGIEPDLEVSFTLAYAQGSDPQKERAIETMLEEISQSNHSAQHFAAP